MKRPVKHADGKLYVREWQTGRHKLPDRAKAKHKTISLNPNALQMAKGWELITGQDFSSWVEEMIYKRVHIETA